MAAVTVKWDKKQFTGVVVDTTKTGEELKQILFTLTGVPTDRQKVMCKGAWPGLLKPDTKLLNISSSSILTLIGSAEKYVDKEPIDESLAASSTATVVVKGEGEINAVQVPFGEREDKKKEAYSYSSVVSGYSQTMIENEIKQRKQKLLPLSLTSEQQSQHQQDEKGEIEKNNDSDDKNIVFGKVVMSLGLELDRSYLTCLICLYDGTLVSGSENGHIQLWKHAQRQKDVIHAPHTPGLGIVSLVTVSIPNAYNVAFASGGNQSVQLWTAQGEHVHTLNGPFGSTPVADSLLSWRVGDTSFFAAGLRSIMAPPQRIELAATSRQEAKMVAEADARADAMEEVFGQMRLCVQVWSLSDQGATAEHLFECASAQINALAFIHSIFICGDSIGGIHFWQTNSTVSGWTSARRFRLMGPNQVVATVVCMQPLNNSQVLAVSTEMGSPLRFEEDLVIVNIPQATGVCLLDGLSGSLLAVLSGHSDSVICMCSLPNGGVVTGGGKKDATVQFWMPSLWKQAQAAGSSPLVIKDASNKLKDPGYCLALTILPDAAPDSLVYALAAAKYNAIKVVL